jgi:adenine-specific DNA-methyltransferase
MLEEQYITKTAIAHRREFAQFFTPEPVASLMAAWILESSPARILDPAFGLGVFYREIRKRNSTVQIDGYEIDGFILSNLEASLQNDPQLSVMHADYLASGLKRYDAIICNPPYLRFQKFKNRFEVLPKLQERLDIDLLGYANIASVFLIKSLHQLSPGGRLAYIMPYEFLNAGYGKKLKQILLEQNFLRSIIIFENEKEIFPEAVTTVCVLLCEKADPSPAIAISYVRAQSELENIASFEDLPQFQVERNRLDYSQKWSPILDNVHKALVRPEGFCRISEYGNFKRGIATGANEFFALSRSKIDAWQLPRQMIRPCITKSAQIKTSILDDAELSRLIEEDTDVFCLDARRPLDEHTAAYIEYGEAMGMNKRYLTRVRDPWYKIESRSPSPLLFGVFSRNRYKVIRNFTDCITFTCYHSFYPNRLGTSVVDKLFLYLLSDLGNSTLRSNQRTYGAGLMKFEPNDLNSSFAPSLRLFNELDNRDVAEAIIGIKHNPAAGPAIANSLMSRLQ